ncbi:DEAD/DEAH box helicase domain-containing protein, partial [mine drainage metagenome]
MKKPEFLKIGQEKEVTVDTIFHMYTFSNGSSKVPALLAYLKEYQPGKSIIFSETKRATDALYNMLVEQGYEAVVIHGDLTQAQREKSLMDFRKGAQFLVATNVAARGLDIDDISDIINFDAPNDPEIYVHRVGRSARMGKSGTALTIIGNEEFGSIKDIEKKLRIRMSRIELDQEPFLEMRLSFSYGRNGGGRSQNSHGGRSGGPRGNSSRQGSSRQGDGRFRYPRNNRTNKSKKLLNLFHNPLQFSCETASLDVL